LQHISGLNILSGSRPGTSPAMEICTKPKHPFFLHSYIDSEPTEMNEEPTPSLNILIIEDDYTSRTLMQHMLKNIGETTVANNGLQGVHEFNTALKSGKPYDLICLDIMMPELNGHDVLKQIRAIEQDNNTRPSGGVKIIMTTAVDKLSSVRDAYFELCDGYLTKPLHKDKLMDELKSLKLID